MRIFVSADKTMIIMDPDAAWRVLYYVDIAYDELSEDDEITENVELGAKLRRCLRRIEQEAGHGTT